MLVRRWSVLPHKIQCDNGKTYVLESGTMDESEMIKKINQGGKNSSVCCDKDNPGSDKDI